MKTKRSLTPIAVAAWTALVIIALTLATSLFVATVIASDKSRQRTACLKVAETSADLCPVPSDWENLLRRITGPAL